MYQLPKIYFQNILQLFQTCWPPFQFLIYIYTKVCINFFFITLIFLLRKKYAITLHVVANTINASKLISIFNFIFNFRKPRLEKIKSDVFWMSYLFEVSRTLTGSFVMFFKNVDTIFWRIFSVMKVQILFKSDN